MASSIVSVRYRRPDETHSERVRASRRVMKTGPGSQDIGCGCLAAIGVLILVAVIAIVVYYEITWHGLP